MRCQRPGNRLLAAIIGTLWCLGASLSADAAWRPSPTQRNYDAQLSQPLDLARPADILALDLFTTPPEQTAALRARGVATVCHVSMGVWERWRPDAAYVPPAALGRVLSGRPGVRWLDIANPALRPILERRLDLCRAHGFDGVILADLDVYAQSSGFPVDAGVQLAFNLWLARAAHARDLAVGIVNDLGQATELAGAFDFLVASDCLGAGNCVAAGAFRRAGKPVYLVAYTNVPRRMDMMCTEAAKLGAPVIFKTLTLNGKLHRRC